MIEVTELGAAAALDAALDRRRAADAAEADLLVLAAHWADLHAVLPGEQAAGTGSRMLVNGAELLIPLAGEGTPEVAEFAPGELGAALRMSSHSAGCLIGDALELRHRLPRLWARVHAGGLPAWRARKIAQETRGLSIEAAAFVDAQVAGIAHKVGLARVLRLVDVARRRFDPEAAEAAERSRADGRKVWVSEEMTDGTRTVVIEADALDVTAFDSTLSQIADSLAVLGDPDVQDVRRAKAVGIIADPQGTLDLYDTALRADAADAAETDAATTGDTDTDCVGDSAGEPGPTESTDRTRGADTDTGRLRAGGRARAVRPRIQLHVHLTAAAIKAGTGVARVEELGPATLVLVERWLGRSDITLKPVIDLDDRTSVDGYETPASMRETVLLRNPCCPFPWCTNLTRRKDMDHIVDYVPPENGGPPGQTAPHLLGPLCRRHHRYKTTGGWHYSMPEPGIYLWRSPQGRHYLVDHTGTQNLDATG